ncbi:MAG: phosphopentomutase, partial [Candidatus Zixiibacteriota bacterium]
VPVERLYEICRVARDLLTGEHAVGRVIARPFIGKPGSFTRTARRKDFSLEPPEPTVLDKLQQAGKPVLGIGKIGDLFAGRGLARTIKTVDNDDGMRAILDAVRADTSHHLIFANLVDGDQLWGHRRDTINFGKAIEQFDRQLATVMASLREEDLLIVTADHGCDPTYTKHTDHTREYVPLVVHGKRVAQGVDLGTRSSFADIAATLEELYHLAPNPNGTSFLSEITP